MEDSDYPKSSPSVDPESKDYAKSEDSKSVAEWAYWEEPNLKVRDYMEDHGSHCDGFANEETTGVWGIYDGHLGEIIS